MYSVSIPSVSGKLDLLKHPSFHLLSRLLQHSWPYQWLFILTDTVALLPVCQAIKINVTLLYKTVTEP